MDRPQGAFVFRGLVVDIQPKEGPRKSRSRAGCVHLKRIAGRREKVDIGGGSLDAAPTETISQPHRWRRCELAWTFIGRQRSDPVRALVRQDLVRAPKKEDEKYPG